MTRLGWLFGAIFIGTIMMAYSASASRDFDLFHVEFDDLQFLAEMGDVMCPRHDPILVSDLAHEDDRKSSHLRSQHAFRFDLARADLNGLLRADDLGSGDGGIPFEERERFVAVRIGKADLPAIEDAPQVASSGVSLIPEQEPNRNYLPIGDRQIEYRDLAVRLGRDFFVDGFKGGLIEINEGSVAGNEGVKSYYGVARHEYQREHAHAKLRYFITASLWAATIFCWGWGYSRDDLIGGLSMLIAVVFALAAPAILLSAA